MCEKLIAIDKQLTLRHIMADKSDIILAMCKEQWEQGRQSESQRAGVSTLLVAIYSVLATLIGNRFFYAESIPLAVLLMILGIFGAIISYKYYERWSLHKTRADFLLNTLNKNYCDIDFVGLRKMGHSIHKSDFFKKSIKNDSLEGSIFKPFAKIRLNILWIDMHLLVSIICIIYIAYYYVFIS